MYVENLSTFVVRDTAEVLSLLKMGKKKLIFGETRMNRLSSRYSFVIINYSSVRKQISYKVAHLICVTPSVKKRKKNDCAITVIKHRLKFDVGVQFQ